MHREKRHILLDAAARGGLWTRLSFLIMGAGCIRYKQFVRGAAYLLSEIGFIFFFRDFAMQYLSKFATLGTETQRKVWNEELQIFQRFPGDNSMLILLYIRLRSPAPPADRAASGRALPLRRGGHRADRRG